MTHSNRYGGLPPSEMRHAQRACRGTKAEWGYRGIAPISLPEIFGRTPDAEQITHFYFEEARGKAVGYFPIYTVWKKSFFDDFVKEFYSEIRE